jgi:cyanophycinase
MAIMLAMTRWLAVTVSLAEDAPKGRLLIIGGGTRRTSVDIYSRLIDGAGGLERARIGILPTASRSLDPARRIAEMLVRCGMSADRIDILDLTPFNAGQKAFDPQLVEQVRHCTGLFVAGGDQRRVTTALIAPDGTERPVLTAMRDVFRRGGIIAGSSAGAAVQSELMLAVSGLPADSLDEGFDALDYGLSGHEARRGLHVSSGLGFFRGGMVDQHFNQYRGRLGRLARAAIERRCRFGFGIDENTAIDVDPDGSFEVVGAGSVTIIDTDQAKCTDGPLGCRLANVIVSALEQGDRFDSRTGQAVIDRAKQQILAGQEDLNGNHLIPDIAGEGAVAYALFMGLAENTRRKQVGVTLKHVHHFAHGYRFTFTKTDQTRCYGGYVRGEYSNAIVSVRLDVEPIVTGLWPSVDAVPIDLPDDESRTACQAVWFRGLLLADDKNHLRPGAAITRGELAGALARFIHIEPSRAPPPRIANLDDASPHYDELETVIGAGLFALDRQNAFDGEAVLSRREAAAILARAYELYRGERLPAEALEIDDLVDETPATRSAIYATVRARLLPLAEGRFGPAAQVTRRDIAAALCRIIEFNW